jgi:hypothetical protein
MMEATDTEITQSFVALGQTINRAGAIMTGFAYRLTKAISKNAGFLTTICIAPEKKRYLAHYERRLARPRRHPHTNPPWRKRR